MASSGSKVKVYQRKDGYYYARYFVTFPNGTRKRQYVYGKTKAEVKEKYDKEVANAILGNPLNKNNATVAEYLNQWLNSESLAATTKEQTRIKYAGEIRKHVLPRIGKCKLSSLTLPIVQNALNNIMSNNSVRTAQICRNILSKAFREAEINCLVQTDLIKRVQLPSYHPKPRKIWTAEEAKLFSTHTKTHKYGFFFELYLTYGVRRGEAIPLRWCDIENGQIKLTRQYTMVGNTPTICSLKTIESQQPLPITDNIQAILDELAKKPHKDSDLIVSDNGKPIKPSSVDWEFKKLKKSLGLSDVVLHSLRHFAATNLVNSGAKLKEVQAILRHTSPSTTLKYYEHSSFEDQRDALTRYCQKMQF